MDLREHAFGADGPRGAGNGKVQQEQVVAAAHASQKWRHHGRHVGHACDQAGAVQPIVPVAEMSRLLVGHFFGACHFELGKMLFHQQGGLKIVQRFVRGHWNAENTQSVGKFARGSRDFFEFVPRGLRQHVLTPGPQQKRRGCAGTEGVFPRVLGHVGGHLGQGRLDIIFLQRNIKGLLAVQVHGIGLDKNFHQFRAAGYVQPDLGQDAPGIAVDPAINPLFLAERIHVLDSFPGDFGLRAVGEKLNDFLVVALGILKLEAFFGFHGRVKERYDFF
jgi:hypothetical protein